MVLETHCYVVIATTSISRAGHWRKKDRDFLFNLCHYDDCAMERGKDSQKDQNQSSEIKVNKTSWWETIF